MCGLDTPAWDVHGTAPAKLDYEAGCGHLWAHGDDNKDNTEAHMCPKCGRGPWGLQVPISRARDVIQQLIGEIRSLKRRR